MIEKWKKWQSLSLLGFEPMLITFENSYNFNYFILYKVLAKTRTSSSKNETKTIKIFKTIRPPHISPTYHSNWLFIKFYVSMDRNKSLTLNLHKMYSSLGIAILSICRTSRIMKVDNFSSAQFPFKQLFMLMEKKFARHLLSHNFPTAPDI